MTDVILLLILTVIALTAGFLIPTLIQLRRTAREASEFLIVARESLAKTLAETDETLRSIRAVTDDINTVTRDARNFSSALSDTAVNVKALGGLIGGLASKTSALLSGVGAGVRTAYGVLISNLLKKRKEADDESP